jgi:transposase
MIDEATRAEMRRLVVGEHWRIGTVARRFGVHYSVVRRAVYDAGEPRPLPTVSAVDPFKPYLVERLEKYPELTATRLHAELRERGFKHGVAVLRRYIAHLRGPRKRKAYLRVEVEPAEQAQVDWGSFGHMRIGTTQRPLSVFVMVLSWSRALFLDFSLEQRMETFCRMHQRAFEFFGGIPRKVLYDNLKSVVLHHIGSTVQFNPTFLGFAGHYLFEPTAAPVRYPEAKGRAEAIIKYIRHAFFYGRSFSSLEDLRDQAAKWRDDVANQRLHATTRERPPPLPAPSPTASSTAASSSTSQASPAAPTAPSNPHSPQLESRLHRLLGADHDGAGPTSSITKPRSSFPRSKRRAFRRSSPYMNRDVRRAVLLLARIPEKKRTAVLVHFHRMQNSAYGTREVAEKLHFVTGSPTLSEPHRCQR